jgi:hypothetical protein
MISLTGIAQRVKEQVHSVRVTDSCSAGVGLLEDHVKRILLFVLFPLLTLIVVGCASYDLSLYEFRDRPLAIDVRVLRSARVEGDLFVTLDPDNPIGTVLSIGTSIAKAGEVAAAQERLDRALKNTDIEALTRLELEDFAEFSLGSILVERRPDAEYYLQVEIERYGVDADGPGSAVRFNLDGRAELYDEFSRELIWATGLHIRERANASFFGLPAAAGNVLSAALLAELSEEEMVRGLESIAREAAREISTEIENSIYR